jgi:hypothetical protein
MRSALALSVVFACIASARGDDGVDFARDVLPILSANCFACHGPDEHQRQAELRLDIEAAAKESRGDYAAITPGDLERSAVIDRLTSTDPDVMMPPPSSNRTVTPEEIETIRKWIEQGAEWSRHWSFGPVVRPPGTLDDQVTASLAAHGLGLRERADPHTLVRRLSLDLIGLPPTPEMADAFAADPSEAAYEALVDELLASPQFGEHWARMWLDLARYADTKGYEKDLGRTMWPYRDWVVSAFNTDMPLDQFTVEQLAGDLLPNPTQDQLIATAFHRNTMSNDEGGTDDEEFRQTAIKDRIDTTVQVWMGLTMGCAKCHTHKYDPISHSDYYSFYAIFNQTEDADRYDDYPLLPLMNPEQQTQQADLQAKVSQLESDLAVAEAIAAERSVADEQLWQVPEFVEATSAGGSTLTSGDDGSITATGATPETDTYVLTLNLTAGKYTAFRIDVIPVMYDDAQSGLGHNPADPNFVLSELTVELLAGDAPQPIALANPRADFSQDQWHVSEAIDGDTTTGWAVSPRSREGHVAMFDLATPLELAEPAQVRITLDQQYGDRLTLSKFRISTSGADPATLELPNDSAECRRLRDELAAARDAFNNYSAGLPQVPIMRELTPEGRRETRIHQRGNFLDPGDAVEPSVLSAFHPLDEGAAPDRLGVARWLVSPENPLTPRVWANRIWARLFGMGIVETEEDFGALGSPPTNPELLDWLAAEYRDNGWSLKHLLKVIVMSETYRQASDVTPELTAADPRNEYASRGARYRLGAELVRDQSLAVSGLLSFKMGGPAVMPPQPAGLWRSTYNGQSWVDAEGEDRYRRGIYTYLKRTTPYPSFMTFDGGSGETCLVRRIRTNTPLQALVTLNDPVYLEAAAALASRMVTDAADPQSRAERGLRLALIRPLREGEADPLVALQQDAQSMFEADPAQAEAFIAECRGQRGDMPAAEFAAWIVTANVILNLDEFLTRN